jgi:hypothetical protein
MSFSPDYKPPDEAARLADLDSSRDAGEFLREIYKEAYNTNQRPEDRAAKLEAKHSALHLRILSDHHKIHKSIQRLTRWIVALTIILVILTAILVRREIAKFFHIGC